MPYAANGQISQSPIAGGVEITAEQYQQALDGILRGEVVSIDGGFSVGPVPEPEPEPEPDLTLDDLKQLKLSEMERARDTAIEAGFSHDFNGSSDLVQTRERDRENILGLAVSAQRHPSLTFQFRAKSNTTYDMTADEVLTMADAAQQHVSQQYAISWQLKAQVNDATTAEEVSAVVWPQS